MRFPSAALGEVSALRSGVGFPVDLQGRSAGDYPLAKVGDISRGGRSGRSVLETADHYVDQNDLRRLRMAPVPVGSVLFAKIGEAIRQNHRVVAGRPMLLDNNAMAAIPGPMLESRYLYHFLRTVDFYALASATTVPALRKTQLERVRIPLPTVEEQRRIADILDRADALRAMRRKSLALIDDLTQSIFVDMFGNGAPDASAWPVLPLRAIATTTSGGTPSRGVKEYYGGHIPWVKSGELHQHRITSTEESITTAGLAKSSASLQAPGTVLLAMYGATVGAMAVLDIHAATNQAVCCIVPGGRVTTQFLIASLRQMTPSLLNKRAGGAQPNLSQSVVRELPLRVPPLHVQELFDLRLACVDQLRACLASSARELDGLFASLQNRAFRGEL